MLATLAPFNVASIGLIAVTRRIASTFIPGRSAKPSLHADLVIVAFTFTPLVVMVPNALDLVVHFLTQDKVFVVSTHRGLLSLDFRPVALF